MASKISVSAAGHDREPTAKELKKELAEAREQQVATHELLRVIGQALADPQSVLEAIARNAVRLCGAKHASIWRSDHGVLRAVATHNVSPERKRLIEDNPIVPGRDSAVGRAALDRCTIHIADAAADPELTYLTYEIPTDPTRTVLVTPMLAGSTLLGVIFIHRNHVQPFSASQVALLEAFADQAVIAIENARLFEAEKASKHELAEALEYQTATSEVLGVISRSPNDLKPVLEAIAGIARRLCEADWALIRLRGGDGRYLGIESSGAETKFVEFLAKRPLLPTREIVAGRALLERRSIHVADVLADPEYRGQQAEIQAMGLFRTVLCVPLLRHGDAIGVVTLCRSVVKPFEERQIKLVETFADQAVIAINNVGLFEEVQARTSELAESLEYQTATSEVLSVISRSPHDLKPVLDVVAENAARVCMASNARVLRVDGNRLRTAAAFGDFKYSQEVQERGLPVTRGSVTGRAVVDRKTVHVADLAAETDAEYPVGKVVQRLIGHRTALATPLLRDGVPLGAILIQRMQVKPFTDKQIKLLETFADQAVIAINNVGLFEEVQARTRELQEALEYQTATSDVLNVISRSPSQLEPVFDFIARSASRLCGDEHAIVTRYDGVDVYLVAQHNPRPGTLSEVSKNYPVPAACSTLVGARAVATASVIHIPDVEGSDAFNAEDQDRYHRISARALIGVPMMHQGSPIGSIAVSRATPGPFSERQIDLLQTFADQAVIAIENTRLFEEVQTRTRELTEALEQQTATSKVLTVISSSQGELEPVFQAILENAVRICDARFGNLWLCEGDSFRLVTAHNPPAAWAERWQREAVIRPGPGTGLGRVARTRQLVHIIDVTKEPAYLERDPLFVAQVELAGGRTLLVVPMLKDGELIGTIGIYRQEVRPFSERQIELLKSFANQAVIAIENARLLEEGQSRTRELARSVEELQALGEVGRAVSSTLDLKVVLKTIVDRAVQLSSTDAGSIFYYRKEIGTFELGETTGLDEQIVARLRKLDISARESGLGEAIAKRQPLQIPDLTQRQSEPLRDAVIEAGFRASLIVPLLAPEGPLGTLILRRRRPGEFAPSVVSLMQNFADQSAIALENARLFEEIAQKGRELEIASQHKSQFVANMSHELRTPLAAILGYAELMQEGFYEPQGPKSLDALSRIRSNGKHLLGLINTVLDIAKIDSGQFKLNFAEYALENVVETVRAATESLAETKKLGLKTEIATPLPSGVGDEQRLTQVLLNLVGNAIKFTDSGEVRISATRVNSHFAVHVSDTGPGIPVEEQKRIFEQFHQVDSSKTKAKGGTGLGLAISKQIVEMHGGRIWVESTPGEGATFQMELPIVAENRNSMA